MPNVRAAAVPVLLLTLLGAVQQGKTSEQATVTVSDDGAVTVSGLQLPQSDTLSAAARAYVTQHLKDMQRPELVEQVNGVPRFMEPYLGRARVLYAVNRDDTTIAGVHAYVYTPRDGIAPRNCQRVPINLHGGGISGCWPACAELESIPVAGSGRIRVVSLDYREAPQHHFPAASEDVAAVYSMLLKAHRARDIGIYGCSAGGVFTAISVTWFQQHGLPRPGAIGILCAGAAAPGSPGFAGDGNYFGAVFGEGRGSPVAMPPGMGYLANTRHDDPLVSPLTSESVPAKFPPTLVISASRDIALSAALYTHSQLVRLGVDAELHVWDGLFHGFFYNPDIPESKACIDVIVKFFDQRLGGA